MRGKRLLQIWLVSGLILFWARWKGLPLVLTYCPEWGGVLPELARVTFFRWGPPLPAARFALAGATLLTLSLAHPVLARVNRYPVTVLLFLLTATTLWLLAFRFLPPWTETLATRTEQSPEPGPRYGYLALLAVYYLGFQFPLIPLSFAYATAAFLWHRGATLAKRQKPSAATTPGLTARFLQCTAQLLQSLHVDTTVGLLNLILGPYARPLRQGEPMDNEDREPRQELVPDPTDHDLALRSRTPGMTRAYLERVRQNYVDKQRQLRYETITEMTQSRTAALKSGRQMREAEEDLYSFDEEAQLKRTGREVEQRKLDDSLQLESLRTEVERQKLITEIAAQENRRTMMETAAYTDPDSSPTEAPPPPPVEDDMAPEEVHQLALKGVLHKAKSDRAWKEWQEALLREHSPWDAQKIIAEAARLYDEATR